MSWNDPITIGKTKESQYALDSKIVYCMASYNDEYNEMTLKEFAENFEEKLHKVSFEWKHKKKDGSPRYPSYQQIRNKWFHKYEWERCAREYVEEKTGHAKTESILIYDKKILKDTKADFKLIDSLMARIKTLQNREKSLNEDHTYRIAKLEETITSIWHRIRERLELDKAEDDRHALIPVNVNPLHENQDLRNAWNEILWEHVEPRE